MDENNASTPSVILPARLRHIHLYMPLVTVFLILTNRPILSQLVASTSDHPGNTILLVAASAIPTYLVGSYLYPANQTEPTFEERIRFTRRHEAYRALVLATYGRIYGTPFDLRFFIGDFCFSYIAGEMIGERPAGSRQRRSEFLVALLWVGASGILLNLVPPTMPMLWLIMGAADRTFWRAAYLGLVDDVIKVLTRPDVRSWRGKAVVVIVQSFTITLMVYVALAWMKRWNV